MTDREQLLEHHLKTILKAYSGGFGLISGVGKVIDLALADFPNLVSDTLEERGAAAQVDFNRETVTGGYGSDGSPPFEEIK